MAKNPACFDLIKSLTKAEKTHFKKYLTYNERKGEPTIYLQLFAELDKLKNYDLDKVIYKFRNQRFSKHISTTYNYLYNLLMKSLRDYHADKNIQIKAADMLSEIKVLIDKRLMTIARTQLKKSRKFFEERNMEMFLYQLVILEYKVSVIEMTTNQFEIRKKFRDKKRELLQNLIDNSVLGDMEDEFVKLYNKRHHMNKAELDKHLKKLRLLMRAFKAKVKDNPNLTRDYISCMISLYDLEGEELKAYILSKENIENCFSIYKNSISTINKNIQLYNHLESATALYDYDEMLRAIDYTAYVKKENQGLKYVCKAMEIDVIIWANLFKGDIKAAQFQYEKFLIDEDEILDNNVEFHKARLIYSAFTFHYLNEDFDNCLTWIDKLLNLKVDEAEYIDILIEARIIEIIIHYTNGHYLLINSLVSSLIRIIQKYCENGYTYKVEIAWLKAINKSSQLANNTERKKFWQRFNLVAVELNNINDARILINAWLSSEQNNSSNYKEWQSIIKIYKKSKVDSSQIPVAVQEEIEELKALIAV